ncbi:uncharacterized protein LOC127867437 isoform X2 [Dreissena polymorpha]|uniref:Uncharacterized protein n=2 Tax=Dreissena polymorpha TaxID=45954 RepID=A0A9D4RGU9_DREPO|nr:uncharacterized protein LOC127867437 isoform X2 [Dreissena polymorpha]XP_052264548.1 uncharacterized protein LOC127867437 isoform X2 [Dreissena polymorpha]XP_052264549.1 uncharacterized protein LOC127867437 isoform X2 [Dreissena polymorpha]XP_052264550.1 uncharacterized protein LOC127867437 isoform X2 [Dreissena polymorpha]XP_052264551.1 uncharacterized protein LOC127867437 isoform X2 [Dreissena polymorpha]KAH3867013.1 hypothetical protein DPMN_030138 [Dreissena polymorpha]
MGDGRLFERGRLLLRVLASMSGMPEEEMYYDLDPAPRPQRPRQAGHSLDPEERNRLISRTVFQIHEIVSRHVQQTGDDIRHFLSYEFVRAQLHNVGHNGSLSSVSNRATPNQYRPGRWFRYIDGNRRDASVEKMMGSGDDKARQNDTDLSSADDVDDDDDDENSLSHHNNYDDVSNNGILDGSDVCEESDGTASQYSDDEELHDDPECICQRCLFVPYGEASDVISVPSVVSNTSVNFKRTRRVIKSVKAFFGRLFRCQCMRPNTVDE